MRLLRRSNAGRYMQILVCPNAAAAPRYAVGAHSGEQDGWPPPSHVVPGQCRPDAPVSREQTIETESLTDVQDEKDPDGYGFGV